MKTFKEFLLEGGHATESEGTERANQADMKSALSFIDKHTDLQIKDMEANLLGSSRHTYYSLKRKDGKNDSGDVDIAISKDKFEVQDIVDQLSDALKTAGHSGKFKQSFGVVYSFAVPANNKLIQVDLMFVPSEKWAKWSYHADENSNFKGVYRNLLLMNTAKYVLVKGKDLEIKDDSGNVIIRARRSLKVDAGFERLFKILPTKSDGTKASTLKKVSPDEVENELKKMGIDADFDHDSNPITEPDLVAKMLFGPSVKSDDLLSTEQVILQIKKLKNAKRIFKDSIDDFNKLGLDIPTELANY